MKRVLIILVCILSAHHSILSTESYHPFIEEGKVWVVEHVETNNHNKIAQLEFYFGEDTVVMDKHCSFLMCRESSDGVETRRFRIAPLFEEDGMVYFWKKNDDRHGYDGRPRLLYDFRAKEGKDSQSSSQG